MPPGAVLGIDEDGVLVTARTGAIRLLEVQAEDGPAEPAPAWFVRKRLQPGYVFEAVDPATQAWAEGRGPRPGTSGSRPVVPGQREKPRSEERDRRR
jgi:hypothetical protein